MPELPDMWRVELIHPLVVHFPIALLICGTVLWLAGVWVDEQGRWGFLKPASRLLIAAGALLAWVGVYTGDLANAEVARSLCDPTVKKDHENLSYVVSGIFTGAIVVDLAAQYVDLKKQVRLAVTGLVGVSLLVGAGLLGYVGHLGAQLVYQQGAGVYHPSEDCSEFE